MHVYLESFDLLQNDGRNTNKESSVLDTKTTKKTVRQRKPGKQAKKQKYTKEKNKQANKNNKNSTETTDNCADIFFALRTAGFTSFTIA